MGLQYTVADYMIALTYRGQPTLLVEGVTDRVLMASLTHREPLASIVGQLTIDTNETIVPPRPGMGVRELLEEVAAEAEQGSVSSLVVAVDREWRGFTLPPAVPADMVNNHHCSKNVCWTRGHSSENYLFSPLLFSEYVLRKYPEKIKFDVRTDFNRVFGSVMRQCCLLGICIKNKSMLSRANKIMTVDWWTVAADCESIKLQTDAVEQAFVSRGASSSQTSALKHEIDSLLTQCKFPNDDVPRWMAHGHVGYDGLWSALGAIVRHRTGDRAMAATICSGFSDDKWRSLAFDWAADDSGAEKPDLLIGLLAQLASAKST